MSSVKWLPPRFISRMLVTAQAANSFRPHPFKFKDVKVDGNERGVAVNGLHAAEKVSIILQPERSGRTVR